MTEITFESITKPNLYIAEEIINSNPDYNVMELSKKSRLQEEIEQELWNDHTLSVFIKLEDTYIGIVNYMLRNQKDHRPWIGLFLIHSDYQGYGFGTQAYYVFEQKLKLEEVKELRLGVLQQNTRALEFWLRKGYNVYTSSVVNNNKIDCLEKLLE